MAYVIDDELAANAISKFVMHIILGSTDDGFTPGRTQLLEDSGITVSGVVQVDPVKFMLEFASNRGAHRVNITTEMWEALNQISS